MDKQSTHGRDPPVREEPLDLAAAYAELQNLILDRPDVTDFMQQLVTMAAAIVPGTHCGITVRRYDQVATVVSSDPLAVSMDEIQYLRHRGPCLQALADGLRVEVPNMGVETRWGDYAKYAREQGIHSMFSVPVALDGDPLGALNVFSTDPHAFAEADIARAEAFTRQAATALTILLRQARNLVLDDQLREALATRAVIDQSLGILMVTHKISSGAAFEMLRHASQTGNRKVSAIAEELIVRETGHPPHPPRPLAERR